MPTRKTHIRANTATMRVLEELLGRGCEMEYNDFRRLLASHFTTDNSAKCALKSLKARGFIQLTIRLTATGSAVMNRTEGNTK